MFRENLPARPHARIPDQPLSISGRPQTELETRNRTVLELEPAEPAVKTELAELEPASSSLNRNPNRFGFKPDGAIAPLRLPPRDQGAQPSGPPVSRPSASFKSAFGLPWGRLPHPPQPPANYEGAAPPQTPLGSTDRSTDRSTERFRFTTSSGSQPVLFTTVPV